jgi:hypothetical protein
MTQIRRVTVALTVYVLLVAAAAVAFQWSRQAVSSGPHSHYIFFGPALALFTHLSYVLFARQSLLLTPWMVWGIVRPRATKLAIAGFCVTWLGIGWYPHDLF